MNKALIIPSILISFLVLLILLSYLYPYFTPVKIVIYDGDYSYNIFCFSMNVSVKKTFDCYYILYIENIKIFNSTYPVSQKYYIYSTNLSQRIYIDLPLVVGKETMFDKYVNATIEMKLVIISSLNTTVTRIYNFTESFKNANYYQTALT